jgi:hypothetical protein
MSQTHFSAIAWSFGSKPKLSEFDPKSLTNKILDPEITMTKLL